MGPSDQVSSSLDVHLADSSESGRGPMANCLGRCSVSDPCPRRLRDFHPCSPLYDVWIITPTAGSDSVRAKEECAKNNNKVVNTNKESA